MGNTFGKMFAVTTWGESHGDAVGVVIDGCPPKIKLDESDIQSELDRRRPAQSKITTQRKEQDKVQIISGVFEGRTLGTPIMIVVWNEDARSKDYNHMKDIFRPSHADYTYQMKYGVRNWKGGGRSSARETVGRVASGAIAKLILRQQYSVEITSYVKQIADMVCELEPDVVDSSKIENNSSISLPVLNQNLNSHSSSKHTAFEFPDTFTNMFFELCSIKIDVISARQTKRA